jgi:hypothetical protein
LQENKAIWFNETSQGMFIAHILTEEIKSDDEVNIRKAALLSVQGFYNITDLEIAYNSMSMINKFKIKFDENDIIFVKKGEPEEDYKIFIEQQCKVYFV